MLKPLFFETVYFFDKFKSVDVCKVAIEKYRNIRKFPILKYMQHHYFYLYIVENKIFWPINKSKKLHTPHFTSHKERTAGSIVSGK